MSSMPAPAPLVLVAASGLGLEAADAARASGWEVRGCLDDDTARWGSTVGGLDVLGGPELVADHADAALVVCAGKGAVRERIVERLAGLGVSDDRYATIVAPSVRVPTSCTVGAGSVLLDGTVLTSEVTIGRHVVCMPAVVLTHHDVVDDYATLCAGVVLGGSVRVGRAAYLGMSACVRETRTVGAGAVIGMGAVVLGDVPPEVTWMGNPAGPRARRPAGVPRSLDDGR